MGEFLGWVENSTVYVGAVWHIIHISDKRQGFFIYPTEQLSGLRSGGVEIGPLSLGLHREGNSKERSPLFDLCIRN